MKYPDLLVWSLLRRARRNRWRGERCCLYARLYGPRHCEPYHALTRALQRMRRRAARRHRAFRAGQPASLWVQALSAEIELSQVRQIILMHGLLGCSNDSVRVLGLACAVARRTADEEDCW